MFVYLYICIILIYICVCIDLQIYLLYKFICYVYVQIYIQMHRLIDLCTLDHMDANRRIMSCQTDIHKWIKLEIVRTHFREMCVNKWYRLRKKAPHSLFIG